MYRDRGGIKHQVKMAPKTTATVRDQAPIALAASDSEFLADLGRRVRKVREQRDMARKFLSQAADVSERYLAQLEAGEGNASIVLLRRVAGALGVHLTDLLDFTEPIPEQRLLRRFLDSLPP